MIFYISTGLFAVSVVALIISMVFYNGNDFWDFAYNVNKAVSIVTGFIFLVLLVILVQNKFAEPGNRAKNQERYKRVLYEVEHASELHDEFSFNKKEIVKNVEAWNYQYTKYYEYRDNYWIGIFYGRSCYDDTNYIDINLIDLD